MEKKSFKNVFSKSFVAGLAALALTGGAKALTLNEKVNTEIENGSYVIGISKFTPDQILTGNKVNKAAINDMAFNVNVPGYAGQNIYYFLFNEWFELDDANNYNKVTDAATINSLNSRDVYYVNNVEKVFKIKYNVDIPEGSTLQFNTGNANRTVTYANGELTVPATVRSFTSVLHSANGDTTLDTFVKTTTSSNTETFDYVSNSASAGSIVADERMTSNATVNGDTITVNGTVKYYGEKDTRGAGQEGAGHRAGVMLSLPTGTNLANLDAITVDLFEGEKRVGAWKWSDSTNRNSDFWLTPIVEAGKTYTVKVVWQNGVKQEFKIVIAGTLEEMPDGTLVGQTVYAKDEDGNVTTTERLTASTNGNKVTFSGTSIDWNGEVTVNVTPNDYYADLDLDGVTVKYAYTVKNSAYDANDPLSRETETISHEVENYDGYEVKTLEDGTQVIAVTIPFAENTVDAVGRTRTVTVDWGTYEQKFDVVLSDNTAFDYPDVAYTSVKAHGDNYEYVDAEKPADEIEVNRFIYWDKEKGGNRITATVKNNGFTGEVDTDTGAVDEAKYLSLRINGEVVKYDTGRDDENGNDIMEVLTFADNTAGMTNGAYTWDFAAKKGEVYTLEVLWNGEKVVKTFKLNVTAGTETALPGFMAVTDGQNLNGLTSSVAGTYNYDISVEGSIDQTTKKYTEVKYDYDLNSYVVGMTVSNTNYTYGAGETPTATVKVGSDKEETATLTSVTGGFTLPVKVDKNKTTVVTVKWDAENTQTFNVKVNSSKVTFEEVGSGNVGMTAEGSSQGNDKKTVTFSGEATWVDNKGYTVPAITITAPQVVKGVVKDANDKETPYYGDAEAFTGVTYRIVGGEKYPDTDENVAKDVTLTTTQETVEGAAEGTTVPVSTFTISDLVTTKATQTYTITVNWTETFSETYTVKLVRAKLVGENTAELTHANGTTNTNGEFVLSAILAYDGVHKTSGEDLYKTEVGIDYADGVTASDLTEVKVLDAAAVPTSTQLNGVVTTKTEAYTVIPTSDKFDLHFTDENRTATVTLTWSDGSVQVINVNAEDAKMPIIRLNNTVVAKEVKNENDEITEYTYSMTVNVGDKINLVKSQVNVSDLKVVASNAKVAYADDHEDGLDVIKATLNEDNEVSGEIVAEAAGQVTLTVTGGGHSYEVKVTVLDKTDKKVSVNATTETNAAGDKVELTAIPTGGHTNNYTVMVEQYVYVTKALTEKEGSEFASEPVGVYVKVAEVEATERLTAGKYVASLDVDNTLQYKYVVTASTKATDVENAVLPAEYSEAVYVIEPKVAEYEVKFVNGASTVATYRVAAGLKDGNVTTYGEVKVPEVTKASTDKYFYVLLGWYADTEDYFDKNGDFKLAGTSYATNKLDVNGDIVVPVYNASLDTATAATVTGANLGAVKADVTLKAVWLRVPKKTTTN